jgi:hypothetical protein
VKLISQLHLVPRIGNSGALPQFPHTSTWCDAYTHSELPPLPFLVQAYVNMLYTQRRENEGGGSEEERLHLRWGGRNIFRP